LKFTNVSYLEPVPKSNFNKRLMAGLFQTTVPFCPRGEISGRETVFDHTVKDFIVAYSLLYNRPDQVTIDGITFPPIDHPDPHVKLGNIFDAVRQEFKLAEAVFDPAFLKLLNLFILYHDIGKQTDSREAHEIKGAKAFEAEQAFFQKFLTSKEIAIVCFLIKYHGLYGQIDKARRTGTKGPDLDSLVRELNSLLISNKEKVKLIRILFFFNIVEGLQSDIFSKDFFAGDKHLDIIDTYRKAVALLK